ncbi:MAG: hypothetical protein OEY49_18695, partial [Candidatus Heimdallarchaeota archaeon]|nr:hypothetical protein [Candidatus Heimdallarchaeota archaeon]
MRNLRKICTTIILVLILAHLVLSTVSLEQNQINPQIISPDTFVSKWNTGYTNWGSSSDNQIKLPLI